MRKTVTVFGSSIPSDCDKEYLIAYELGKTLALNGYDVCTGGYQGTMDAVSKGAVEYGGKAIGVTVDLFNASPSKHLTREVECSSLFERILKLVELGDAYIILNGGTGTLLELSVIWEYVNKGLMNKKPIVCYGKMWDKIVASMEERINEEKRETGLVKYLTDLNECVGFIRNNI
ncbi:MAG: LOG family protein [Melioribacteraceae bacterium]|nr:LOG family protein [Melioribacteraceae bacterium]